MHNDLKTKQKITTCCAFYFEEFHGVPVADPGFGEDGGGGKNCFTISIYQIFNEENIEIYMIYYQA